MKKTNHKITHTFLILLLLMLSGASNSMTFLNPLKACTFSEMKIKLTLNGHPAADAKITRSVKWKNRITDTFTSDANGDITLPASFDKSFTQVLPVEFVSFQSISVEYKNNDYEIWVYVKRNPEENSELNGKPFNLTCELSDESEFKDEFSSSLITSCKFT